jgi:hypothetical protein
VARLQHQLAGDRDDRDRAALVAVIEAGPALVQASVAGLGAVQDRGRLPAGTSGSFPARAQRSAVVPGGLDQQPTGMGVAGLGDPALDPPGAGGELRGHQTQVGTDGEPVNRCQSVTSTQSPVEASAEARRRHRSRATGPAGTGVAGGYLGDRGVEPIAAEYRW